MKNICGINFLRPGCLSFYFISPRTISWNDFFQFLHRVDAWALSPRSWAYEPVNIIASLLSSYLTPHPIFLRIPAFLCVNILLRGDDRNQRWRNFKEKALYSCYPANMIRERRKSLFLYFFCHQQRWKEESFQEKAVWEVEISARMKMKEEMLSFKQNALPCRSKRVESTEYHPRMVSSSWHIENTSRVHEQINLFIKIRSVSRGFPLFIKSHSNFLACLCGVRKKGTE